MHRSFFSFLSLTFCDNCFPLISRLISLLLDHKALPSGSRFWLLGTNRRCLVAQPPNTGWNVKVGFAKLPLKKPQSFPEESESWCCSKHLLENTSLLLTSLHPSPSCPNSGITHPYIHIYIFSNTTAQPQKGLKHNEEQMNHFCLDSMLKDVVA